jgi:hypothetical protein
MGEFFVGVSYHKYEGWLMVYHHLDEHYPETQQNK